jgi:protein-tyrosine-phosphatase
MSSTRILFTCTLNSVRSPMAAGWLSQLGAGRLVADAAGVHAQPINPFAVAVMQEVGVDLSGYIAKTLHDLPRAAPFSLTIALSEAAFEAASSFPRSLTGEVLLWDIPMPRHETEHRDRQLASYRVLRDDLRQRIAAHFALS